MANVLQGPGNTPLPDFKHMMKYKQFDKIRQCLENLDYDVNNALQDEETPLMRAVRCTSQSARANDVYSQILQLLLRHPRIDINSQTEDRPTALHVACGRCPTPGASTVQARSSNVVKILLDEGRRL